MRSNVGERTSWRPKARKAIAVIAAFALSIGTVALGSTAASAGPSSVLQLVKKVDGQDAVRDLTPGTIVTYSVNFSVENQSVVAPVTVTDVLPAAFEGWEILGLSATVNGSPNDVSTVLPGVTDGGGNAGTIGAGVENRMITVGVNRAVDGIIGMSADDQGVLTYQIKIPEDLSPDWEWNNADLVNTAVFEADGNEAITQTDDATISVAVPVVVDVTPSKAWSPAEQGFQIGAPSQVTIGGTQSSNVNATSLSLQDPADPTAAPDGATSLDAANPFNYVDFAGFANPEDPTTNLPAGAESATVEVYHWNGTSWNWTPWVDTMTPSDIAGVRTTYTGDLAPGTPVSQSFDVEQRGTHRTTEGKISEGYTAENDVRATVVVDGQPPVSKDAEANLVVGPEQIEVEAGKSFLDASGNELTSLTAVGGDTVGVVLHARNKNVPASTSLDSLTVREPADGADAEYFSDDLAFAGFDNTNPDAAWPNGATEATVTWILPNGDRQTLPVITAGSPLPAAPGAITGFEIEYTSTTGIEPGALADIRYSIKTSENLGEANAPAGPFKNVVDVTGKRNGLDPVADDAEAHLTVVAPAIDVVIDKRVSPSIVEPGDDVIVQLPTTATASGSQTKPTKIVVTDEIQGAGTFWDAYDLTEIVAPVQVPAGGTLVIQLLDADGEWTDFETLTTDSAVNIPVPGGADVTGVRYVYTNPNGFPTSTNVKPNLRFEARDTLRLSDAPTAPVDENDPLKATPYENTATADGTGTLGDRVVTDDDEATATGSIRPDEAFGPGPLWADKNWLKPDLLTSQSGATASSQQRWALTAPGYESVVLTDPNNPTADGVGTVFEAFDLRGVKAITLAQDPALQWDSITAVELYNGTEWVAVTAPTNGWMGSNGFVGYTLDANQRGWALGIRLTVEENAQSRAAAAAPEVGDIGAPAVGSGVSASAAIRGYTLDWQLRDRARGTAQESPKWVTSNASFNCGAAPGDFGCIDNVFRAEANPLGGGAPAVDTDNDQINLIDGTPNVSLEKSVTKGALVAPNYGDLDPADYPTTRYSLTAKNASESEGGAAGIMKLSRLRVTDVASATSGNSLMGQSPFAGRVFSNEASTNHFDQFNVTGLSFAALPAYIDKTQSTVELWLYNDGLGATQSFSIAQIEAGDAGALLADVIGVSVTYQGTSPEINGNRIIAGDKFVMNIDVQLRAEKRASGAPVTGGPTGSAVRVSNDAFALGEDLVVNPGSRPTSGDDAHVDLSQARIEVKLAKSIAVTNTLPGADNGTIYEADPQAPTTVTLKATPGNSTAPLHDLTIEDQTPGFWEKFQLVSFGAAGLPTSVDRTTQYVLVGTDWVEFGAFTADGGDLADVIGVRTVFDRADGKLFPLGATSWSSGWGSAIMPFTVQLRADAGIDWHGEAAPVENSATTIATRTDTDTATDGADAEVDFSQGEHKIKVEKRAPNDTGNHQVNPLDSLKWKLIFTNTGNSLLPIETVTDQLPTTLVWDGEQPGFSSTSDGLTVDPADIAVALSDDGRELGFTWPEGSTMKPGEVVTIELGLILQPGLTTGQRATNEVVVDTGEPLAACTQPTKNGQAPNAPASNEECSNTNYVSPLVGTYVNGMKTVNGEIVETDGEFLVDGGSRVDRATNLPTGEACSSSSWSADGYTRTPCIAYTAVGATDSWNLDYFNIGTNPLSKMVIVDMLPTPGDNLLAGYGFERGSNFRPVIDSASLQVAKMPAGTQALIEVTTNAEACYSTGSTAPNRWTDDPTCSSTANPANVWTSLADYLAGGGSDADIAGIRVTLDLAATPLAPGQNVIVNFETQNRVIDHAEGGLQPTLADYQDARVAWNQSGVMAWDITGAPIPLPKAPPVAGVTLKTADLVVSKDILGDPRNAPESFPVALSCTVPDGTGGRTALDLGDYALLQVPGNLPGTEAAERQSVVVPNLPIGANCDAVEVSNPESGPVVGEFGEIGRSVEASTGVNPSEDGLSAELRIRDNGAGSEPAQATLLSFANTYALGDLVIEKSVRSTSEYDLTSEQRAQSFEFLVECVAGETVDTRKANVKAGEQVVVTDLPAGARCAITETDSSHAVETTVTVAGDTTDGVEREGVVLNESGTHVLFTNGFEGPKPVVPGENGQSLGEWLSTTGGRSLAGLGIVALLGILVGAGLLIRRRTSTATSNE